MGRYHVYTGMRGYMPDGDDGIGGSLDVFSALGECVRIIGESCEYRAEVMRSMMSDASDAVDAGMPEDAAGWKWAAETMRDAWRLLESVESAETLALNCETVAAMGDGTRELAPIYREDDGPRLLADRAEKLLGDCDGLNVFHASNLYVEQCEHGTDCEEVDE